MLINSGTIDTERIKERVDLVELAGADTTLRKVAAQEWAGPCPKCSGTDRLHVNAARGLWMCRQCHPKWGDAIEYLQWRDGLGFADACAALGGGNGAHGTQTAARAVLELSKTQPTPAPSDAWQERARAFVAWSVGKLWQDERALAYWRGRGLSDDTIRAARLGYNPRCMTRPPEPWGEAKPVYLAAGWVIPCERAGALQYVKVRQERGEPRYLAVRGSRVGGVVYGLDNLGDASDLIICEGEINALTLAQVLGPGSVAVVSVGAAGNAPGPEALAAMATARRWWLAFDPDKAGEHGRDKLKAAYARARALVWPFGDMDVNAAHMAGVDLRAWALDQIHPEPTQSEALSVEAASASTVMDPINTDAPEEPDWLADVWDFESATINADPLPWWAGGPGREHWRVVPAPAWAPPEAPGYPRTWWHNAQADAWHSVT